jgi:hypothetical protein
VDVSNLAQFNVGADGAPKRYLFNVIDVFSKYAFSVPVSDKTGTSMTDALKQIITSTERKPNKIWTDHGSEFFNKKFEQFLEQNNIKKYVTGNEGKSVVVERFNRTLNEKIHKHMTAKNTNRYIDDLSQIVSEYNNTKHRTIKMTPKKAVKNPILANENMYRRHKFKVGDKVRISLMKKVFAKGFTPNWSEEVFVVDKVLLTLPVTYVLKDLAGEPIVGSFYEQELQKTEQDVFVIEKVIRKKGDKSLVKWRGYSDKFNSWIPTKQIMI